MKFKLYVPVDVEITDPAAAFQSFLDDWGDDLQGIDRERIGPTDLILHAGRIGVAKVEVPDEITDPDWLYMNGNPEDDEYITKEEIENDSDKN